MQLKSAENTMLRLLMWWNYRICSSNLRIPPSELVFLLRTQFLKVFSNIHPTIDQQCRVTEGRSIQKLVFGLRSEGNASNKAYLQCTKGLRDNVRHIKTRWNLHHFVQPTKVLLLTRTPIRILIACYSLLLWQHPVIRNQNVYIPE
jgi:hypothetical protein